MPDIVGIIANVGFPAAFCIVLIWWGHKVLKDLTKAMSETTEALRKLSERMTVLETLVRKDDE